MKRLILLALVSSLLLLTFAGCNDSTAGGNTPLSSTPEGTTLENVTPTNTTESTTNDFILVDPPVPSYAVSAQVPTEWEIGDADIPVLLSFGLIAGQNTSDYCTNIVFTVENEDGQSYELKNIDIKEIEKSEYVVNYVRENNENIYAHTESITLPLSVFSGTSGTVLILMREWVNAGTAEGLFGQTVGVRLSYTRDDANIFISSREFVG